jgi:hypothetical protein
MKALTNMNLILGILMYLFTINQVNGLDIIDCTSMFSPVKLEGFSLVPNQPKPGEHFMISINASTIRDIGNGTVQVRVQVYDNGKWDDFVVASFNYCDTFQCPIKAGKYRIRQNIKMPRFEPGYYRGRLTAVESSSGQELICIKAWLRF